MAQIVRLVRSAKISSICCWQMLSFGVKGTIYMDRIRLGIVLDSCKSLPPCGLSGVVRMLQMIAKQANIGYKTKYVGT